MHVVYMCVSVLLVALAAGTLGGLRGLTPMSQMLTFLGVHVIANQVSLLTYFRIE